MGNMIVIDYWICDECKRGHYGMCYKCGECGRKFDRGFLINYDDYPDSED